MNSLNDFLNVNYYPLWFWFYIIPGVLMWIAMNMRNFIITCKKPNQSFKMVFYAFVGAFLIPFWPVWAILNWMK